MEANWIIIIPVIILAVALVIYLLRQNLKDKKELTEFLNDENGHFKDEDSESNDVK